MQSASSLCRLHLGTSHRCSIIPEEAIKTHGSKRKELLYLLCEVCRGKIAFLDRDVSAFLQLPLNLFPGADERDTVYSRHDRLLHYFPRYLSEEHFGELIIIRTPPQVVLHALLDHICNIRIYVRRPVGIFEIDLPCTTRIAAKSSIVLQAITCPVLMYWQRTHICIWVGRVECGFELHASGQALPWIVGLLPPFASLIRKKGILGFLPM